MITIKTVTIYFGLITVISYLLMAIDKKNARTGRKRISETSLLIVAALGGSCGILLAMYFKHHKKRKKRFTIGVPIILVIQIVAIFLLLG